MSNATAEQPAAGKAKRVLVRLSKSQWIAARYQYESGELKTYGAISGVYGCSEETVSKRAQAEGWEKGAKTSSSAITKLRQATDTALTKTAEKIATRIGAKWEQDLAPWFEKEKRLHVRDSIKRSKLRQKLLDQIVENADSITPKDAAFIARSDDIYDQIKRRNLGMSDGASVAGALNVNILTGSAAVQFAPAASQ